MTTYWWADGFWRSESVCNHLNFQGGNCEFDKTIWLAQPQKKRNWKWLQPLTTQLWFIATRVRIGHTSLCTISVNVDCRDEFAVCHGVYAMSRELKLSDLCLEVLWQSTVSIVTAFRRQESCIIPLEYEKRSSDLLRSQEAESKYQVRVSKRGSYYLVDNSVRSRNHTMSVTLNLGAVGII